MAFREAKSQYQKMARMEEKPEDEIAHRILECPVCLELPAKTERILQCSNGHLICKSCHGKLTLCPMCREKLDKKNPMRNLTAEQFRENMDNNQPSTSRASLRPRQSSVASAVPILETLPCRNRPNGCDLQFRTIAEMVEHQRKCGSKRFTNVYVKNFNEAMTEEDLQKMFEKFGNITSLKLMKSDDDEKNKGFGFVSFDDAETAEAACAELNGTEVQGKTIYVGPAQKKAERQMELKKKFEQMKIERVTRFQGVNLYVKNLDDTIDDERLRTEFTPFGTITSANVMCEEGRSKGFGFVCFSSPEEATKAVNEMNGRIIVSKPLYVALAQRKEDRKAHLDVGRAQKKAERQMEQKKKFEQMKIERVTRFQGVNLYVKNLDDTIDDERLRTEFTPFGTITSANVMCEEGRSKGFGFVCFSSPEEATKAVTEMNGRIVVSKPLYVALAQRKEDRKAHLASQYVARADETNHQKYNI